MGTELPRFWSSEYGFDTFAGLPYDSLTEVLLEDSPLADTRASGWYRTLTLSSRDGPLDALLSYERHSRLEGPPFLLLVLLIAAGLPFARGNRLALGLAMAGAAAVALLAPIASAFFDARYAVPGYGPLAAAAAVGGAALAERAPGWAAQLRARGRAPAPMRP